MAQSSRTYQLGRLAELRQKKQRIEVEIDAFVKALLVHFEPLDRDMVYIATIIPARIKELASSIEREYKIYTGLVAEIKKLEEETGERENVA